jgi:hypothetical protein
MAASFEAAWADYTAAVAAHEAAASALRQAMHSTRLDAIDLATIAGLREVEQAAAAHRELCVTNLGNAPCRAD